MEYNMYFFWLICLRVYLIDLGTHTTMHWLIGTKLWVDARYEELITYLSYVI